MNPDLSINNVFLRSLILMQGMGIILYQRGYLVLHGSAVQMKNEAVAFLGQRGNGKSTITIALNNKGYPIISDDVLPIKLLKNSIPLVFPSLPKVKLYSDVIEYLSEDYYNCYEKIHPDFDKYFYNTNTSFKWDSAPLKTIYIIEKSGRNEIQSLRPQEKLISLVKNTYSKPLFGSIEKIHNLEQCKHLFEKVRIKRLNVFHSFKKLEQLIEIVENDIL